MYNLLMGGVDFFFIARESYTHVHGTHISRGIIFLDATLVSADFLKCPSDLPQHRQNVFLAQLVTVLHSST